jgi:hypothetical protein
VRPFSRSLALPLTGSSAASRAVATESAATAAKRLLYPSAPESWFVDQGLRSGPGHVWWLFGCPDEPGLRLDIVPGGSGVQHSGSSWVGEAETGVSGCAFFQ